MLCCASETPRCWPPTARVVRRALSTASHFCLAAADDAEAERLFAALADGGRIQLPLMATPFASRMGIVADRFGVPWMVIAQAQSPGESR
jgi:uncharacterized glyoxalase superfamily protein PhnB